MGFVLPDVSGMVVVCVDVSRADLGCARALDLSIEGVTISPDLEDLVVTENVMFLIEILYEDYRMVLVPVPPLVAFLEVGVRVFFSGFPALAST